MAIHSKIKKLFLMIILIAGFIVASDQQVVQSPQDCFESALLELGAVPLKKLDDFADDPVAFHGKGQRLDYNGWLSPYDAINFDRFVPGEKEKFFVQKSKEDIIARFDKFRKYLDLQKYPLTRNPHQLILLHFLLEIARDLKNHNIEKSVLIKLFEEYYNLAPYLVPLLENRILWQESAALYKKTSLDEALDLFPVAFPFAPEYLHFLKDGVGDERLDVFARFRFQGIIDQANRTDISPERIALGIKNVLQDAHRKHREIIYSILTDKAPNVMKDHFVKILHDEPTFSAKLWILRTLRWEKIYSPKLIEAVMKLADCSGLPALIQNKTFSLFDDWLGEIDWYLQESADVINDPQIQQLIAQKMIETSKMRTEQFNMIIFSSVAKNRNIKVDFPEECQELRRAILINNLPASNGSISQIEKKKDGGKEEIVLHINEQGEIIKIDGEIGREAKDAFFHWRFQPMLLNGELKKVDLFTVPEQNLRERKELSIFMGLLPETGFSNYTQSKTEMMRIIKGPLPIFPSEYYKENGQEMVKAECKTDIYGRCRTIKIVLSGGAFFDKAVIQAAKQWIIEPYILSGIPRQIRFNLNVLFVY